MPGGWRLVAGPEELSPKAAGAAVEVGQAGAGTISLAATWLVYRGIVKERHPAAGV